MRLLVTGASGFIGRNVLLALSPAWEVVALHRPGNTDFLRFVDAHQLAHIKPVGCDLTNAEQVWRVMQQVGETFDACLALASNTSIPDSIKYPVQDLTTNVIGLLHILRYATFSHLIYLSSGAVYIGLQGKVGPTSALTPTLPYAISKLAAEHYIRASIHHADAPKSATIIRFFGAYGPYEPERKLYTKLVRQFAVERNPYFTVNGDGENYIDAMYVGDAVKALIAVVNAPAPEGVHCVDLGVGSRESINQVVTRAAHTFGLEPQIYHEGATAEYIQFVIDPQPFSVRYQFVPAISLETGLRLLADHLTHESTFSL